MSDSASVGGLREPWVGAGRFEVCGVLGEGPSGVLYDARDRASGAAVALKVMEDVATDAVLRVKHELRLLERSRHPNLVTAYDLHWDGQTLLYSEELVRGVRFLEYVRPSAPSPDKEGVDMGRLRSAATQLAGALVALHTVGLTAKGPKPADVLVTPDDRVKLVGFGLPGPGDASSPSSDWHGFGVLLFRALTGRLPVERATETESPGDGATGATGELLRLSTDLLHHDPARRPSGAEVLRRLLGGADGPPVTAGALPDAPLVGRGPQLRDRLLADDALDDGRGGAVFVPGRPGVGKTRLLFELARRLRAAGRTLVLDGRCSEREHLPFKALDGIVEGLADHLSDVSVGEFHTVLPHDASSLGLVFPALGRVRGFEGWRAEDAGDPVAARRRAKAALRELLGRMAARRPVVLIIDDLHWGDVDSATFLLDLLRPPGVPTVLVVAAYCSHEVATSPCLRALLPQVDAATELPIGELEHARALELAAVLLEGAPQQAASAAEGVARASGGSPSLICELARQARQAGASGPEIGVDDLVRERVRGLPTDAWRLLQVVAVAGRPLELSVAHAAAQIIRPETSSLPALLTARLLRLRQGDSSTLVEPYDERIARAVATRTDRLRVTNIHTRLAFAVEAEEHVDQVALANHYRAAGEPALALGFAKAAADDAVARAAFSEAVALLEIVLELRAELDLRDPAEQVRLLTSLGEAMEACGRGADAGDAYLRAAELAGPVEGLELRRRAGERLLSSGHVERGCAVLRPVLATFGVTLPERPAHALALLALRRAWLRLRGLAPRDGERALSARERVRLDVCWSIGGGLGLLDPLRGALLHAQHLVLALRSGDPRRTALSLAVEVVHSAMAGSRSSSHTRYVESIAMGLAERLDDPYVFAVLRAMCGVAAWLEGRWDDAAGSCEEAAAELSRQPGAVGYELGSVRIVLLDALVVRGDYARVAHMAQQVLADARSRDERHVEAFLRVKVKPRLHLAADRPDLARSDVEDALTRGSVSGLDLFQFRALYSLCEADLYEGRAGDARERMTSQSALLRSSRLTRLQLCRVLLDDLRARCALAEAAAAGEGSARAGELLVEAARHATALAKEGAPWASGIAAAIRGCVAAARGDVAEARKQLLLAEQDLGAVGMYSSAVLAARRRGELDGNPAGSELVRLCDTRLTHAGVVCPQRFAAMMMPCVAPSRSR